MEKLLSNIICPNCETELELSQEEILSKKFHCPECEAFVDLNSKPPKVLDSKEYTEIISLINQGDVAVLKSVLDDEGIDYYVIGENFPGIRPLNLSIDFYVNKTQIEKAKETLKDLELHIGRKL